MKGERRGRPVPVEDDLLEGFSHAGRRAVALRGFFAVTITGALIAWDITFTFGAYHTVFYHRINQLLVVCLVVLLGKLSLNAQIHEHAWLTGVFAVPTVWVLFRLLAPGTVPPRAYPAADGLLIGIMVLSLPLVLWVVARLLAPGYFSLPQRRMQLASAGIIVAVAGVGYLVGVFNDHFYTCEDFALAGDHRPEGCARDEP